MNERAFFLLLSAGILGWLANDLWRGARESLKFDARLAAAEEVHNLDNLRREVEAGATAGDPVGA